MQIFSGMPKRLLYLMVLALFACGQKKIDLSGATPLKAKDFLTIFPVINGNFLAADSNFLKIADTTTIGLKAITQFIPDTAITNLIGNDKKTVFHAVGRIQKDKELYLLVNIKQHRKTVMAVFVLNSKNNQYLASKILIDDSNEDDYVHTVSINKEPTFVLSREKSGKDNVVQFSRTGWVYTSNVGFMVIVNDSNENPAKSNVINPIDTLAHKNKYSADYEQDKKNFISLRDGKNPNTYIFFIHFEKNEGSCIGELKGELKMKDPVNGQYIYTGDPCIIDFKFEGNEISVKEQGSCGNHRGIKCFFDDSYPRKKEPKSVKKNKH